MIVFVFPGSVVQSVVCQAVISLCVIGSLGVLVLLRAERTYNKVLGFKGVGFRVG